MRNNGYEIDKKEVLRYLGHRGQTIDRELIEKTDLMIERCLAAATPLFVYRIFDINQTDEGIRLENSNTVFPGENIKRHLSRAVKCALLAATLGVAVERELGALQYTDMAGAVIFNAACTALTEQVADHCCLKIAEEALMNGYTVGSRYSPGYGDFPLSYQREILSFLDASRKLGITLTDSLLMVPRKSVTAVVGLFRDEKTAPGGCGACNMRGKCEYERQAGNRG